MKMTTYINGDTQETITAWDTSRKIATAEEIGKQLILMLKLQAEENAKTV